MKDNTFETKLKTSNLTLAPDGGLINPQEPYAILSYNNIKIRLSYSILYKLICDCKSESELMRRQIFNFGRDEILIEMRHDMTHSEKIGEGCWHRDNPQKCSLNHEWQSRPLRARNPNFIKTDTEVESNYGH